MHARATGKITTACIALNTLAMLPFEARCGGSASMSGSARAGCGDGEEEELDSAAEAEGLTSFSAWIGQNIN